MAEVKLKNISKIYSGDVRAVSDMNLDILTKRPDYQFHESQVMKNVR